MKTILTALSAAPLMLALAAPAAAQGRPDAASAPDTQFTFTDGDDVEGRRVGTELEHVRGRRIAPRHSLVRPRVHFVPEMLKSVETL